MNDLLSELYYKDFPSVSILYKKAKEKNPKITYKIVKDFLKNTEETQIYRKRPTKFYHLKSYSPFERVQIDILDLINYIPKNNDGYRYLFLFIDVYTRYVFAIPIKTRKTDELYDALTSIIKQLKSEGFKISQIDSDNESGFNSKKIVDYLQKEQITQNFSNPEEHNNLGVIDRFCRTIRELFNKYTNSRNTTRWIDYYQTLINAYNNREHRSLKTSPLNAIENNEYWLNKMTSQTISSQGQIRVGDKVRLLKNKQLFEKGSENNYTKQVFKVIGYDNNGNYTIDGRERTYKFSQLLPVGEVINYKNEELPNEEMNREEVIKKDKKERKNKKILRKEGVDENNVVNDDKSKRIRKEVDTGFNIKY